MAINSDIRDQAYQFFVEEAPELLQTIESGLLTLRQTYDKNTVHSVMRAAHSIKGGSASVGLDNIKQIAHRLETIFKALYSESLTIDADLESQLLAAYDCLRIPLTTLLETGAFDAIAALDKAETVLGPLEAFCHDAIQETADFVPTSADMGFNMTASIFEVDVAEGIQRLETALVETPDDIAAELRAQAEVFIGFSELLNLPGFGDIARTAVTALNQHPDRSIELATLAIANLKAGREAVLQGEPIGEVSSVLQQLATDAAAFNSIDSNGTSDAFVLEGLDLEDLEPIDASLPDRFDLTEVLDPDVMDDVAEAAEVATAEVAAAEVTTTEVTTVDVMATVEAVDTADFVDTAAADVDVDIAVAGTTNTVDTAENVTENVTGAPDSTSVADATDATEAAKTAPADAPEDAPEDAPARPSLSLQDESYQFFVQEAPELLDDIESGLLTLRRDRNTATIHSIMRAAHSIKGGAASVGLETIKTISHRLETIFKALYSDSLAIDAEMETQLLAAFDCLRLPLTTQLNTGTFDAQAALAQANAVLSPLEERCQEAIRETEDFVPTSEELGIDMTAAIFETDVADGIHRVEGALFETPEAIAAELREQAGVFIGFAELFNLPGFGKIAQAALSALEAQPHNAAAIATLAIENLKLGQAAVLAGDKIGGEPMPALVQFTVGADPIGSFDSSAAVPTQEDIDSLEDSDLGLLDTIVSSALEDLDGLEALAPESGDRPLTETWPATAETDGSLVSDSVVERGPEDIPEDSTVEDVPAAVAVADDTESWSELPAVEQDDDSTAIAAEPSAPEPSVPESSAPEPSVPEPSATTPPEAEQPDPAHPGPAPLDPAQPKADSDAVAAAPQASPPTAPPPSAKAPVPTLTVRVDAERLARMNNLLGEITINRNGLDLQNTQAQNATRELQRRFERFQTAVEGIRTLSDQLLLLEQHSIIQRPSSSLEGDVADNFDALEMDRYSTLYAQTQLLLEEIVQLEEAVEDVTLFTKQSGQMLGRHRKMLSQMQDELMWARMLPAGTLLNRFPRVLRDMSNRYDKPVRLTVKGTNLLVDKAVLEKLYDPMLHLLRNGFDHGIEPIAERRRRGKPAEGEISVTATYRGRQVIIVVQDDGQGLDSDRIRQRAVQLGLIPLSEIQKMRDKDIYELIFEPGFSTATRVSDLSGRGVGLDVVREQVRELNGHVTVSSTPGEGTTFTLRLPLTLTVLNLLVCFVGSTPLAFRSSGITEVIIPKPGQTSRSGDDLFLHWQGRTLPVYQMTDLLSYNCLVPEMPPSRVLSAVPSPADWDSPMLILQREKETIAIQVARLVTEQELVVKPFGRAVSPPSYAYGCTVLGDGSIIPVLDGLVFLEAILAQYQDEVGVSTVAAALERAGRAADQQDAVQMTEAVTLLVIDDAVTSRRTLALSLERAGYRILQARDGKEGLEQLDQNPDVQLIVCDVEMPNMNGFEFLTHRRKVPAIAEIPTVMLTSRSNDKHRWLAKQLGATDYFTKPYLEQKFLEAIASHLEASLEAQMATSQ